MGIGTAWSDPSLCTVDVQQRYMYGVCPLLFTVFTNQLHKSCLSPVVAVHWWYSDLLCSVTRRSGKVTFEECFFSVCAWFCFYCLEINPNKSETVMFGSCQCLCSFLSHSSIDHTDTAVLLSNSYLGVTMGSNLTFQSHMTFTNLVSIISGQYIT